VSHISTIKVQVRSLDALRAACARLGFTFQEAQQTYKWYGRYLYDTRLPEGIRVEDLGRCEHAIQVPGAAYEVGVVRQGDHYTLLYDFWYTGGLEPALGKNAERLVQAYTIEAAIEEATRQGYSCWEEGQEDGSVKLHVSVGG
jgi:hypothetical protein